MSILLVSVTVPYLTIVLAEELKPSKIFSLAEPGVVWVVDDIHTTIIIPTPNFDSQKMLAFLTKQGEQGLLNPTDKQAVINAEYQELAQNPLDYLIPSTKSIKQDVHTYATGSGFIISSDGYVVTNAHVAAPSRDELVSALAPNVAAAIFGAISQSLAQSSLTEIQKLWFTQAQISYMTRYASPGELQNDIFALPADEISIGNFNYQTHHARLVTYGGSTPGKDVAILKMEGSNFQPIPLGDDYQLSIGDKIFIIGYPGAATFNPALDTSKSIQPTFTSGIVSAKKETRGGWTAIQTDATMTHGNSGGPALDESGKIVGIATFGSADPNTGQEIGGLNFLVPTSVLMEFVTKSNAKYEVDYPQNSLQQIQVPAWLKNNAKWWAEGSIGDSDFIKGIQYMMQNGIMKIPQTKISSSSSQSIPVWIKNNAKWWSEGSITNDDFVKGIQYLVSSGIITMTPTSSGSQTVPYTSKGSSISQNENPPSSLSPASQSSGGFLKVDKSQYSTNIHSPETATISGKVKDPKGGYVVLKINYPDGRNEERDAYVTSVGSFSSSIILDRSFPAGTYTISGNYYGLELGSVTFLVNCPGPVTYTVRVNENKFEPNRLVINRDDSVVFKTADKRYEIASSDGNMEDLILKSGRIVQLNHDVTITFGDSLIGKNFEIYETINPNAKVSITLNPRYSNC